MRKRTKSAKPKTVQICVRITEAQHKILKAYVNRECITIAQLVENSILTGLGITLQDWNNIKK